MYYEGNDENHGEHLEHFGVKGMKWGVRRTAAQLANHIRRGVEESSSRNRAAKEKVRDAKTGNRITSKNGSVMTRKTSHYDNPAERKKRIDADIKEADERVKFYGSKRAAKAAIKDEAGYAKAVNRGKAFTNTLLYGGVGGLAGSTLMAAAVNTGAAVAIGGAAPLFGVGLVSVAAAKKANSYINKHANDQILYTDDSEYGHDMVVTFKKHD